MRSIRLFAKGRLLPVTLLLIIADLLLSFRYWAAVYPIYLSGQGMPRYLIIPAVIGQVCTTLLAVIGRVNMWAAVFLFLSMVPQTVSIMLYARYDAVQWPKEADARRHAEYCENQLQYSVPACELATFDAQPRMAKLANGHQRRLAKLCTSVEYRSIRFDAITGLMSLMLLVAALLSLIFADVQPSTLAGGLVGIFSGIIATNGVGYMTGSLISSSVAVQSYIAFVDGSPASATSADSCERATESRDAKLSVATLQLSHIAVTYPNAAAPTVSDMSLEARRGEMIAIVGANGAGKTTTIQGMLGMLPIVSGALLIAPSSTAAMPNSTARARGFLSFSLSSMMRTKPDV